MEAFSKVLSLLLFLAALFFCPLLLYSGIHETASGLRVMEAATTFVEKVKYTGFVSANLYEELVAKLETSGEVYDICLEHGRKLAEPEWETEEPDIFIYYTLFSTDEILNEVYGAKQKYYMEKGDTFQIVIRNLSGSMASGFRRVLFGGEDNKMLPIIYGGIICDELE